MVFQFDYLEIILMRDYLGGNLVTGYQVPVWFVTTRFPVTGIARQDLAGKN